MHTCIRCSISLLLGGEVVKISREASADTTQSTRFLMSKFALPKQALGVVPDAWRFPPLLSEDSVCKTDQGRHRLSNFYLKQLFQKSLAVLCDLVPQACWQPIRISACFTLVYKVLRDYIHQHIDVCHGADGAERNPDQANWVSVQNILICVTAEPRIVRVL